ncbi:unnamed protein product, partial [Rotaria magnacalcarata]
ALEWCQQFLGGIWSTISIDEMILERVPGGLSNYLYSCSLPNHIETQNSEPRKVLLRYFSEVLEFVIEFYLLILKDLW